MQLLIIDGYNAIHALPELKSHLNKGLERARDALAKLAREWKAGHPACDVLIVYDGQSGVTGGTRDSGRGGAGIRCVFTPSRVEADDHIKKIIRKQGHDSQTIVITRDREILSCCRDHGVRFETPDFLLVKKAVRQRQADAPTKIATEKNKKEISDWYRDALKKKGAL